MAIHTSYTNLRENLASLLDEVENNRETLIVQRRGHEDIIIIAADDYHGLEETAYLLRSPRNAERLLSAFADAKAGKYTPMTVEDLKRTVGFDDESA